MTYKELADKYADMLVCTVQMEQELSHSEAVFEDLASDIYSLKQSPLVYPGDLEDEIEECRSAAYQKSEQYQENADQLREKLHELSGNDEKIEAFVERTEDNSIYIGKAVKQLANENFAYKEISPATFEMLDALCQKCDELDDRYWSDGACSREDLTLPDVIPEIEEIKENLRKEMNDIPIYWESPVYAMEHGELNLYRSSHRENDRCREAIEKAIRGNFDGIHLKEEAVKSVLAEFGAVRVEIVLASTLQENTWDARFSKNNKTWAGSCNIPRASDGQIMSYEVSSHPVILNGFIDLK